ncbi:MAG: UDP-N-acetylmuramate dehydrogenase [Caldilineaceae bacterium]|nr:UDP-N-acetylmuramate dehydrogenase [Caldilineaceae bacterium]
MNVATQSPDLAAAAAFGVEVKRDVALAPYTTMKVGGPADYFATATDMPQLMKLVRWARRMDLPYFILGGGSNVLISDRGMRGLVIDNRSRAMRVDEPPCCEEDRRPYLFAESGAAMAGVARFSVNQGLTGLEWAVSVPGTIGGAVVNNAGAHGGEVKDNLAYADLLDEQGELVEYRVEEFAYAYRHSSLKRTRLLQPGFNPVVLCANFRLERGDAAAIRAKADGFLAHRRSTQPVEPSLGSTFVNPPGDYAGRLIEAAGLKGARAGGVEISAKHANFIVNPGGVGAATAADVVALIERVQAVVAQRCGVHLEPEIQLAGDWDVMPAFAG